MFTLNFLQFFGTTLVEGGLEGLIMGVTKEAMEFPSLSGSLDFFLAKVSGLMRDDARCT